ncbi:MAG: protoporphyrinogen oxidase [Acidimicrobiales bacterium]
MSVEGTVAVVGGGIAGLTAALRLHQRGARVTIIEADTHLGGKLRTTPFAGRLVDEGADAFLLRVPWALDMCRELGIEGELVNPGSRTAYIYSRGKLHPLPPQLMGVPTDLDAVAEGGLLSDEGLDRLGRDLTLAPTPLADGDDTVAAVVERRLGPEVLERLVDPLIGGINAGDTRRLSLRAAVPQLDAAARDLAHPSLVEACRAQQSRSEMGPEAPIFASPSAGMGRLVGAVTSALEGVAVRVGTRVDALGPDPAGGGSILHLDDGSSMQADAVVVAVPPHVGAPLLREVAGTASALLAGVEHASVAIVTLAVRRDDIARSLDASGFLVPRVEHLALTACSWTSAKWHHLGPGHGDGTEIVRASVGRHGSTEALDLGDDDLIARVLDDLAVTMALRGAPTEVRVSRWPQGFPQYAPGHLERIDEVERLLPHRVALAGAGLRGVGVPACIRSGNEAADRIAGHLHPARA